MNTPQVERDLSVVTDANGLRILKFDSLRDAAEDAQRILDDCYFRKGNWTLGQICRHLRLVQDPSVDGYPKWISLFAFLRPLMRRVLLPKALSVNPLQGIRTMGMFEQVHAAHAAHHLRFLEPKSNLSEKAE